MLRSLNHPSQPIIAFLQRHSPVYLYILAGMEHVFCRNTTWYTWEEDDKIKAVALLYANKNQPLLILLTHDDLLAPVPLYFALQKELPLSYYAYVAKGLTNTGERYFQMYLDKAMLPAEQEAKGHFKALSMENLKEILAFYSNSYPTHFFKASMLRNGIYIGYYIDNELAGIAGTSVFSKKYNAASLGNIATHPEYRGRGIASELSLNLCHRLLMEVAHIGLSVHTGNNIAINMYRKLGYEVVDEYRYGEINLCTIRHLSA